MVDTYAFMFQDWVEMKCALHVVIVHLTCVHWCLFAHGQGLEHNGNGCAYPCINDFFHTHSQVN